MTLRARTKAKPKDNSKEKLTPAQVFYDEYQELCDKHGYIINVVPAFRSRDDGPWSIVLEVSVAEQPKGN